MPVCASAYVCSCLHACVRVCVCVRMHACNHALVCMCVLLLVYVRAKSNQTNACSAYGEIRVPTLKFRDKQKKKLPTRSWPLSIEVVASKAKPMLVLLYWKWPWSIRINAGAINTVNTLDITLC